MHDARLSLVHIISSLEGGGMEKFAIRFAARQRAQGHDAQILALRGGTLEASAREQQIPLTVLDGVSKHKILQAAEFFRRNKSLDIIHAHNPSALHYAAMGKLLTGAKLIYTDHAQTRGIIRVPARIEWMLTAAAVGCSEETTRQSGAQGRVKRISTIHNGIDIMPPQRSREEMRTELGIAATTALGVMPAAFHKVKGHDVLLHALAQLDPNLDVKILLVGEGNEFEANQKLAETLGLNTARVEFLGFRNDVPNLMGAADFFVLPSRSEGLPLAVLEAMAAYLPIIATPVGGVPELVDSHSGILVGVDDFTALANAIARIAESKELRDAMGKAGHQRVIDNFSFDEMTRKYERVYRSVL